MPPRLLGWVSHAGRTDGARRGGRGRLLLSVSMMMADRLGGIVVCSGVWRLERRGDPRGLQWVG